MALHALETQTCRFELVWHHPNIFARIYWGTKQVCWDYFSEAMQECKPEIKTMKPQELHVHLAEAREELAVRLVKCCFANIHGKKNGQVTYFAWQRTAFRVSSMRSYKLKYTLVIDTGLVYLFLLSSGQR